jgi:hypothetical protein
MLSAAQGRKQRQRSRDARCVVCNGDRLGNIHQLHPALEVAPQPKLHGNYD